MLPEHLDTAVEQRLAGLLHQSQAGDHAAYEQFLLEAREFVRMLLRDRLRSVSALDDVLQETLLSIHRSRHSYDPTLPIGPWIRAIALNRLRDFGRSRRRQQDHASADFEWECTLRQACVADAAGSLFLRGALRMLSDAQREVIWLLKFEGYSVAEIAGRTGRSAAAVKVTAHRAYRLLRTVLGAR